MKKVLLFQNNMLILRCRKLIINLTKGDTTMKAKEKELINRARKKLERIDNDNCYSLSMDID